MKIYSLLAGAALALASPAAAQMFDPWGPIGVPVHVEQGIDFVYVDPQLQQMAARQQPMIQDNWMLRAIGFGWGPPQRQQAPNPLFLELRRGLDQYHMSWGRLPQIHVPAGAAIKAGSEGQRLDLLRQRMGMAPGGGFDDMLTQRVREYQRVHGLKVTGIADAPTIRSLNRGADHYMRRIALNLERARKLPGMGEFQRYVVVDSGSAEVQLFNHDRVADSMRAIVGSAETKTPMLAVLLRGANVNPYWNVPSDMVQSTHAPRVLKQGVSYLKNYNYEVLTGGANGQDVPIDPKNVDWKAVAAGRADVHLRQLPGPWNSMGQIKFETPNQYGIYLHDTPSKELFAKADRWVSNGCVRLEDAKRFSSWVFGGMPQSQGAEQYVQAPQPVPVYMTYLTVEPSRGGVVFRGDPYDFDDRAAQRLFGPPRQMASAGY